MDKYKVTEGRDIRPDQLRTNRGRAIYRVAKAHPYVSLLSCKCSTQGDDLIMMTVEVEVYDNPVNPIKEKEPVVIKCPRNDDVLPFVWAVRNDFPLGLPHSNAVPYDHPVSLCVSDVSFQDMRISFNAFYFIESIRQWFAKNAVNELHEANRPLEVFFSAVDCTYYDVPFSADVLYRFLSYEKRAEHASVVRVVSEDKADYCQIELLTKAELSGNIRAVPRTLGELNALHSFIGEDIIDAILTRIGASPTLRRCVKPLMLTVMIPLKRDGQSKLEDMNLYAARTDMPAADILHRSRILGKQARAYLESIPIHWSFLIPEPSADTMKRMSGVKDSLDKVTILGVGALGSAVVDNIVRSGRVKTLNIVDNDVLMPHNVTRHILDEDDLMEYKVGAVKKKYKGIDGLKIHAIKEDFLCAKTHTLDRVMTQASLVMDISTSVAVERHLALDLDQYGTRRGTLFLNPQGTDEVLLVEDMQREHRLDLLEMDYYRQVILSPQLEHHLEQAENQTTNYYSCRSESVVLSNERVKMLSAAFTMQIGNIIGREDAGIYIWQLNPEEGTLSRIRIEADSWHEYKAGDVRVFVSDAVLKEMNDLREERLAADNPIETGGTFIGAYDVDRRIVYVVYMIPAPQDSVEQGTAYIRGVDGLADEVNGIVVKTAYQMGYLGEWHSHPRGYSNKPSATDEQLYGKMSKKLLLQDRPFVMGILSDDGLCVKTSGI